MRRLTASQKIAQLEHRIAQLEKEALFGLFKKDSIESTLGDERAYEAVFVPTPNKYIEKDNMTGIEALEYIMKMAKSSTVNEGMPYNITYSKGAVWLDRGDLSVAMVRLMSKYERKVDKEVSLSSFKDMADTLKKKFRVSRVKHVKLAHVEKEALLGNMKEKITAWVEENLPYRREIRSAVVNEYGSTPATEIAKDVLKKLKGPEHKAFLREVMISTPSLKGRVALILNANQGRTASITLMGALSITALLVGLIHAIAMDMNNRKASMGKESGSSLILFIIIIMLLRRD